MSRPRTAEPQGREEAACGLRSLSAGVIIRSKPPSGIHQGPGHNLTARVSNLPIGTKWELSSHTDPLHSGSLQSQDTGITFRAYNGGVGLTVLLLIYSRSKIVLNTIFLSDSLGPLSFWKRGGGLQEQPPSYHTDTVTVSQILLCPILNTLPDRGI